MKKTLLLATCMGITLLGAAQSTRSFPAKRVVGPTNTRHGAAQSGDRDVIWSDDFSVPGNWVIAQDPGAFDLDWQIGVGLTNTGSYPTAPIESTTAANGFAMLDSDAGNNTSGTEESAHITTTNAIDLTGVTNVILEFENHYRLFPPEACYVVVSTDGTFPLLNSSTDITGMPNVFRLFSTLATNGSTANPETISLDISSIAGGQSNVKIRFHWTGAYGYSWYVDDVALIEQLDYELVNNYGVISHTGNGEEYGRVPPDQFQSTVNFGTEVLNFGVNAQTAVSVGVIVTGPLPATTEVLNQEYPLGDIASGATAYMDVDVNLGALAVGVYNVVFDVTSNESGSETNLTNNVVTRQFGVDVQLYAIDGIGVYDNNDLLGIGSESFTGAEDGLEIMSYYEFINSTTIYGVEAVLANGTEANSAVIVSLHDTAQVFADNLNSPIAQSDVITVTQADLDAGSIVALFITEANVAPGAYYASVRLLSAANAYPITILDDATVPQPGSASLIYIPGDVVYTNGNASAVRAVLDPTVGISENSALEGVSLYPNPSRGLLRLNSAYAGVHTVQVMNLLGAVVTTERINANGTIDLSSIAKGVYMVRVSNATGSMVQRVTLD